MKDDLLIFAAKWDAGNNGYHPLVYHLIDSGVTAQALWQIGLSRGAKQQISDWLGLPDPQVSQLLAFWIAMHDIGKATPSFQRRYAPAKTQLEKIGLAFPVLPDHNVRHHSLLSAWILEREIDKLPICPKRLAKRFLLTIAGHHGVFPTIAQFDETTYREMNVGDMLWQQMQTKLLALLDGLFDRPKKVNLTWDETTTNAFLSVFTGFLITTDWIASNTNLFAYHPPDLPADTYYQMVTRDISEKIRQLGWEDWLPEEFNNDTFAKIFPDFTMNSIQQEVVQQTLSLDDPFLLILEAPTGSGKTEAALYVADYWMKKKQMRGLYVAMPTQATSNQMYDRVTRYLQRSLPGRELKPILVHGNALTHQKGFPDMIRAISDNEKETSTGETNAMAWFTPRKRTLLAPFGVGTVDQTFLAVLRTSHFALRLFGLFRKVIVFDEVHAYDVYMIEIFKRLLGWLRSLGCSVILLSATLPEQTRVELLKAFNSEADVQTSRASFPRLGINCDREIKIVSVGRVESRKIFIKHITNNDQEIVRVLKECLKDGGCAAVICNTVDRAQCVFQAIRNSGHWDEDDLILLHSRFPYCWREQLEKEVLSRFGKLTDPVEQPRQGIVVSTQIIEQSLDLDFDFMITDLAPVDLLIQRIGRLQRHQNQAYPPQRPPGLQQPVCVISTASLDEQGMPKFGADRFVYEEVFLQRTYFVLRGRSHLCLPDDSDELINLVYSDTDNLPVPTSEQRERLKKLYAKMLKESTNEAIAADNRLLNDIGADMFTARNAGLSFSEDDENLTIHRDLRALTRSTQPTVTLICLLRNADGRLKTLDGHLELDLKHTPQNSILWAALRSAVRIGHHSVVGHFMKQAVPSSWKKSPYLRYAFPLEFEDGKCILQSGLSLKLDQQLGIMVIGDEKS